MFWIPPQKGRLAFGILHARRENPSKRKVSAGSTKPCNPQLDEYVYEAVVLCHALDEIKSEYPHFLKVHH